MDSLFRLWRPCRQIVAIVALLSVSGCFQRVLEVRSQPPGAAVFVNGEEVGVTPCDHPFTFYGTVEVMLRAPGYLTRSELETLDPPWYQIFPLDLVTDLFPPWILRDVRRVSVELVPAPGTIDRERRRDLEEEEEALRDLLEAGGPTAGG